MFYTREKYVWQVLQTRLWSTLYFLFKNTQFFVFIHTNDAEQALKPHASLPKTYPCGPMVQRWLWKPTNLIKTHAMVQSRLSKQHTLWYSACFQHTRYGTKKPALKTHDSKKSTRFGTALASKTHANLIKTHAMKQSRLWNRTPA
jgi:hypothetical protein